MHISNLNEAYTILKSYVPPKPATGYTLDVMQTIMTSLGNPQNNYKVIHIAGTSGKTSTAYYVTGLLRCTGATVGLTVSPHVTDVNERVQINGLALSEGVFCRELGEFLDLVSKLSVKPSYYELLVAFAFWEFDRQGVDYAVVEVGLGGLLDGTNVISRADKVCIITDIGLDHVRLLGDTVGAIAAQKAGIIHEHNTVFCYAQNSAVDSVISQTCRREHAELHIIEPPDADPNNFLPIFQQRNFNLALAVVRWIVRRDALAKITDQHILQNTHLNIPGRMETIMIDRKSVILDGAHNGQKMAKLVESISAKYPGTKFTVLLGISAVTEQKTDQMLEALLPITHELIITAFRANQDEPKATANLTEITRGCNALGFTEYTTCRSLDEGFNRLMKSQSENLLICGSLYLLQAVRPKVLAKHATVGL